jgi:hypothetical protein
VLSVPVHRFKFTDRPHHQPTIGFIAQEVEEIAPYAVDTTTNAVPSLMCTAKYEVEVADVSTYRLHMPPNTNTEAKVVAGDSLKILYKDFEFIRTVESVHETMVLLTAQIPAPSQSGVFVYGHIVNDFKLINNDRMMPLVFNAIKSLYSVVEKQQHLLDTIVAKIGI